jgi:hypothetical protein
MSSGADMSPTISAGQGGRCRLSLVLALVLGLLASLIHCANCEPVLAGSNTTIVAMDFDGTTPPDAPDHKTPLHCGHCLSHVTGQTAFVVLVPTEVSHHAPPLGREQTLTSLAGLPLFKPPRA